MSLNYLQNSEILFNLDEVGQIEIKSKNWKQNYEKLMHMGNKQSLRQINIVLDFKLVKRICEHVHFMKKSLFNSLESIIFIITQSPQKQGKQIDFSELNRISQCLQRSQQMTGLNLKLIHPFDTYTIPIKQIRFIYKQTTSIGHELKQESSAINKCNISQVGHTKQYNKSKIKQTVKIKEAFYIHFKNIKSKITLPFQLNEETMIKSSTLPEIINSIFKLNQFVLRKSQYLYPIFTIDSINIGEIDLSRDISSSFVVFLNEFLSQLDVSKIKSLSFKARQSENKQSLLKEYLYIFAKFLSRCNELFQVQIILDFGKTDLSEFSSMFKRLILNSLSSNICPKLSIVDMSFSNLGQNNQILIQELQIASFISSRIDRIKMLNIRCYSADTHTNTKIKQQDQTNYLKLSPVNKYLNLFMSDQKFGVEEFENGERIRHVIIEFGGIKEMRLFLKRKVEFSQILLFCNSKKTIESLSHQLGIEQERNTVCGNYVTFIDIMQVIQEKSVDEIWTVLINELFMSCKQSIKSIICNIKFDEHLQSLPANSVQSIEGIGLVKTQQRRPFELMIISFLQRLNYKQLQKVAIKNTIYDITFNSLLLKSICASKLSYFEVSDILKMDNAQSIFMIKLTNQTTALLDIIPQHFQYSHIQCASSVTHQIALLQIKIILQKQNVHTVKSFQYTENTSIDASHLDVLLQLVKSIPYVEIVSSQFRLKVNLDTVIFLSNQIDTTLISCFNHINKKYLMLYITYQQYEIQNLSPFNHFKYINVYLDNSKFICIKKSLPTQQIINLPNVHKITFYPLNKKQLHSKTFLPILKAIDQNKLLDLFLSKLTKSFKPYINTSKYIKILQYFKIINLKSKFRLEIIKTLLFEYLI